MTRQEEFEAEARALLEQALSFADQLPEKHQETYRQGILQCMHKLASICAMFEKFATAIMTGNDEVQ